MQAMTTNRLRTVADAGDDSSVSVSAPMWRAFALFYPLSCVVFAGFFIALTGTYSGDDAGDAGPGGEAT